MQGPTREQIKNKRRKLQRRAAKSKVPFSISTQHLRKLYSVSKCPVCKVCFAHEANKSNSRSVDRIVPVKGYTDSNTTVLCRRCNMIKGDQSMEELVRSSSKDMAIWAKNQIKHNFNLSDSVSAVAVEDSAVTVSYTKEFKDWFKSVHGLKRWSPKKFERWILGAITDELKTIENSEE